jgi:ACS family pantothenate transporter-like MFS transporter
MLWVLGGALEAFSTQSCLILWMKASEHFSIPQINTYPLGVTAVGMACC